MGRKREVLYYNGRWKGKHLTDKECEVLDKLYMLSEDNGYVSDLKNCIYDLSPHDVEMIKASKSDEFVGEKQIGELTDAQTVGVAYAYYAKRLVLADSVGMGKTVILCGLLNLLEQKFQKLGEEFRFLYLTEKSLVESTQNKLIKFTGNYIEKVYGDKDKVRKFVKENDDELLYSVVGAHSLIKSVDFQEYIRSFECYYGCNPFDVLVIDESKILANSGTQMYKDAKFLADKFNYVIILNATPFESNLTAYYNQLNFVDDTFLPTKQYFQDKYVVMSYTGPYPTPSGKYKNVEDFKNLVRYRCLARTRKSTGAVMKDCSADVILSPLSSVQRELLKRTQMPYMVYDCPSYFSKDIQTNPKTTPKIQSLVDLFNNELKDVESILIYSRYKESQRGIQNALLELGIESHIMNGDTNIDDKNRLITSFKLRDIRVLITNVQKGLDFGNCNHCIFYSYDPNPNNMVQFEGRMTREYNIIDKHVYILISKGEELNKFKSIVVDRAQASDLFAGSDFSCVLSLLLDNDKLLEQLGIQKRDLKGE